MKINAGRPRSKRYECPECGEMLITMRYSYRPHLRKHKKCLVCSWETVATIDAIDPRELDAWNMFQKFKRGIDLDETL